MCFLIPAEISALLTSLVCMLFCWALDVVAETVAIAVAVPGLDDRRQRVAARRV